MNVRKIKLFALIAFSISYLTACNKDYFYTPPPPKTSQATTVLEAQFVQQAPATLNAAYWKTADYLKVNSKNMSTGLLYGDGMLNMTGTFGGLTSFNNGTDPGLTLKAAYDNNNLYVLAEWTDLDVNPGFNRWLWNGPADPRKSDDKSLWTSQDNTDHLALAFQIEDVSGPSGNFSTAGCAASCHTSGTKTLMQPNSGKLDIWNWSVAISNPLGYAQDMISTSSSFGNDNGQGFYTRNRKTSSDRSGPAYEWDGSAQSVTQSNGQPTLLNPLFFLYNKMPFKGDVQKGDSIYHRESQPGECYSCHGEKGEGATEQAINTLSLGSKSRESLKAAMDNAADMAPYWGPLSDAEKDNILAYLKGMSGAIPGAILTTPDGSNADIKALSNISAVQINNAAFASSNKHTKYQVLLIRKLNTGNQDDIKFDPATLKTYKFGVALMNADGINHVGSPIETLNFK